MAEFKYYKLGTNAHVFVDPISKLKVLPGLPGKVDVLLLNKRIALASGSGHIIEIKEGEYEEAVGKMEEINKLQQQAQEAGEKKLAKQLKVANTLPAPPDYSKLSDEELRTLALEQVDENDEASKEALKSYKKKDLIKFLTEE
jgi:hypothetical protein